MIPRRVESERLAEYQEWFEQNKARLLEGFKKYLRGLVKKARNDNKEPNPKHVLFIGDQDGETAQKWISDKDLKILRYFLTNNSRNCAYCEQWFSVGLDLDHFLPKSQFLDLAFDINNLVPSCSHCNSTKGAHVNQNGKEIINPYTDRPKDELFMNLEDLKLEGKGSLGKTTLLKLGNSLNSVSSMVFDSNEGPIEVKGAIVARKKFVDDLLFEFEGSEFMPPNTLKKYLEGHLNKIPDEHLSATRATVLCHGTEFRSLVEALRRKDTNAAKEIDALILEKSEFSLFKKQAT